MLGIKKDTIQLADGHIEYISFGTGKPLVILPGLGDGLKTVYNTSIFMKSLFKHLQKHYKIYIFSYKKPVVKNYPTEEIAHDCSKALNSLKLQEIDVLGISFGGMIAQILAAETSTNSIQIDNLFLCSSPSQVNNNFYSYAENWIKLARESKLQSLYSDFIKKLYCRPLKYSLLKPAVNKVIDCELERFIILTEALKNHNSTHLLQSIEARTLIIGGAKDIMLTADELLYLKQNIPQSKLIILNSCHNIFHERKKEFSNLILNS